ncbi:hypothetical protein VTN02DRAFT_2192 [Thermoascus thermophilus]
MQQTAKRLPRSHSTRARSGKPANLTGGNENRTKRNLLLHGYTQISTRVALYETRHPVPRPFPLFPAINSLLALVLRLVLRAALSVSNEMKLYGYLSGLLPHQRWDRLFLLQSQTLTMSLLPTLEVWSLLLLRGMKYLGYWKMIQRGMVLHLPLASLW